MKYFYSHLFWNNPGVRELFPEDMEPQRDRLFTALTYVVAHLDNPGLPAYLKDLGRDHRKFLAQPAHYAAVGTSLLAAFEYVLGNQWTPKAEKAWTEAYTVVSGAMIAGAQEAEDAGRPNWWDCEVVSHTRYNDDLAVLTLLPREPLPFRTGQYVSVSSPRVPSHWRTYSIGNAPRVDGTVDLHISRVEGGSLSTALVQQVREGEVLRLSAAGGSLTLRTPVTRPLTFIAAGTGWAPVRALLEELAVELARCDLRLFSVARHPALLYDRHAVEELRTLLPQLDIAYVTPAPGRPPAQATDRLVSALGSQGNWPAQDVYLAGPPPFVHEVKRALTELGTAPERIFHDSLPAIGAGATRPLGPSEWFLNRPEPQWHDPSGRIL
ncbi:globin domain-containing protein [Streptomyces sp. NPDC050803]|uniref:globin domain-containing protein n=1 Tax=unclassified Streptomyces TaxID=2593676 RepID=UPI00342ECB37